MSTHGDGNTVEAETGMIEESSEENNITFYPELLDERIKANLQPLHAQIFALAKIMVRIIRIKLTTETTTTSTRGPVLQLESFYSERPVSPKFPTVSPLTTTGYWSDMVTGASRTAQRRRLPPHDADMNTDNEIVFFSKNRNEEYSQRSDVTEQFENIIDSITTLPRRLQSTNRNQKPLHTQVLTFRGNREWFNELEHVLRNHLRTFCNRHTGEAKLQFFLSLLREGAIDFFQSVTISQFFVVNIKTVK